MEEEMKCIVNVVVGLMLVLGGPLLAEEVEPPRTISVSGTVAAKTAPDQVVWRISLSDFDKDLRAAKKRNDAKIESVLALREKLAIPKGDMETGHVSIRREYERGQYGHRGAFKHFAVSRSVTVRQSDLERFDEYLDAFVSCGEMEVNFSFESSKIHAVRAEARLKAVMAAKDKAAAMAGMVGAKLGQVLTIDEHPQGGARFNPASNSALPMSQPSVDVASGKFIPGAINVRVTVYATFELVAGVLRGCEVMGIQDGLMKIGSALAADVR